MNIEDVLDAIYDGELDDSFDQIYSAIKNRKDSLNSRKLASFNKGDKVVFNENSNPAYLNVIEVEIVKLNKKTVTVDFPLDPSARRFSAASGVRVPISMVSAI